MQQTPPSTANYDLRTIVLHWLSAALIVALWLAGQSIDYFPKGVPRITVRSLHISAGVCLTLILALRLTWRARGGARLPAADPGWTRRVAIGTHYLLYSLLMVAVLIGMACVWVRGDTLFYLFTVPHPGFADAVLREEVVDLHGLVANTLLTVAGLHASAALWHHLALKDGVMRRMWPALARRDQDRSG